MSSVFTITSFVHQTFLQNLFAVFDPLFDQKFFERHTWYCVNPNILQKLSDMVTDYSLLFLHRLILHSLSLRIFETNWVYFTRFRFLIFISRGLSHVRYILLFRCIYVRLSPFVCDCGKTHKYYTVSVRQSWILLHSTLNYRITCRSVRTFPRHDSLNLNPLYSLLTTDIMLQFFVYNTRNQSRCGWYHANSLLTIHYFIIFSTIVFYVQHHTVSSAIALYFLSAYHKMMTGIFKLSVNSSTAYSNYLQTLPWHIQIRYTLYSVLHGLGIPWLKQISIYYCMRNS